MEQFARDFGYLDKFLAGIAKHADTLPPERGGRLKQLMAEESGRWEEVKRLLAGGSAPAVVPANLASPAAVGDAPHRMPPEAPVNAGREAASGPQAPVGLTVGSLLGVPKK